MDGWMAGWLAGWMDGWTDGRMDGWTDGRMVGWMDILMTVISGEHCELPLPLSQIQHVFMVWVRSKRLDNHTGCYSGFYMKLLDRYRHLDTHDPGSGFANHPRDGPFHLASFKGTGDRAHPGHHPRNCPCF